MLMLPKGKFDVVQGPGDRASDRQVDAIDRALKAKVIRISNLAMASRAVMDDHHKRAWICLEVKERREAWVEKTLDLANIETLIPWLPPETVIRRGRKWAMPARPIYAGYLFVHCALTPSAMHGLLETKHVLGMLGGADRPHRISLCVINDIMKLSLSDTVVFLPNIQKDDRVYVIKGPYVFLEGKVVKVKKGRASIELSYDGRKQDIEMPLAYVRKL